MQKRLGAIVKGASMRRILSEIVVLILCSSVLGGCQSSPAKGKEEEAVTDKIVILCPKTFASVIREIKPLFEKANPRYGIKLDVYPIRPMLSDILKGKEVLVGADQKKGTGPYVIKAETVVLALFHSCTSRDFSTGLFTDFFSFILGVT